MTDLELKRLAKRYKDYQEVKGEPLTLQEFSELFHELLSRFLK